MKKNLLIVLTLLLLSLMSAPALAADKSDAGKDLRSDKNIETTADETLLPEKNEFTENDDAENNLPMDNSAQSNGLSENDSTKGNDISADKDTSGNAVSKDNGAQSTDFAECNTKLYIWGNPITLSKSAVLKNDTLLVPIKEFLAHRGVYDFSVDSENQITITYGEKIISMHLNSSKAHKNGETATLSAAPFTLHETVYAPLRFVCENLGFTVDATNENSALSVRIDEPKPPQANPSELYVNASKLSSETDYLIWIDKSDYTVHVFLCKNGQWREAYSCKCAIGASASPTVNGTFKYYKYEPKWFYDDFYVGPVMRFYNGYAIHSTLIKYDGTPYNNTVGKKISHGCVRVRPDDMNWLVSYVPLKTTIHITEK